MKTLHFNGWPKGMDNIHSDHEIPDGALRRIVNADVLDSGKLRRRKGFAQALAASMSHSLWSDNAGNAYFVQSNTLKRFFRDNTATSLGTVAAGSNRLAYAKAGADVYFTCKTARGKISNEALGVWGIEVPVSPPLMTAVAGAMDAGTYLAVMTHVLADGRESGASLPSEITLATPGSIAFSGIPTPAQAEVTKKRIYLTTANGEVFYRAAEVAANASTAVMQAPGPELRTQYLIPPPFGTALAHALGRLFIAVGNAVIYTDPLAYDLVDPRKNYYLFPADVTLIAPTQDGIYVCADQTYFIAGAGTPEARPRVVFEFGGIAGSLSSIPDTADSIWFSDRGAVIGKDGGAAEIIAKKLVAPGSMSDAAAAVIEKDGLRQFVVVGNGGSSSALQCGSYAEAEITRRSQ